MRHYLFSLLLITGMVACSNSNTKENSGSTEEDAVKTALPEESNEVTVMELFETDFNHELISNGKLSARKFVDLRFESAEPIAEIFVKNGDRVVKGQKLAELSTFRLTNRTAQTRDALERAKLDLQDVLIGQGYLLEDSAGIPSTTMQLAKVKSGYDQTKAQYELALYEERKAVLTAPFDGVVANLFSKQYNIASSEVFCSIIDQGSLEASFTVLESELPLIKAGDKVLVSPFAAPDAQTEGRISEINPLVDANGMVQVKAVVTSKARLFEGMNVRVSIQRSLGKQLVIPKSAVVLRSNRQVVFRLGDNNKAIWEYVETGLENMEQYTILSGLKEGDIVITSGNINLANDAPVSVVKD